MSRHRAGLALAAAGLTGIALATLGPVTIKGPAERLPTLCLLCGDFGTVDFLHNIALFVPFGLGLALTGIQPIRAVAVAAAVTLGVEALQGVLISGRHAALGDVIANTLGGLVGATTPAWTGALRSPSRPVAAGLVAAVAALSLGLAAAPVALFRPSPAPTETWWGQHAHEFGGMAPFLGTVTSVWLKGRAISDGVLPGQDEIKAAYGRLPLDLTARVVTGPIPPLRAQVAAVADGTGAWVAAIWQDGPDAIVSLRLGAADLLLRAPILRIPNAFAEPGTAVTVSVNATQAALFGLAATDGAPPIRVTVPITTTRGWILAWPWRATFDRDPTSRTALWLAGWWLVTGFLLVRWGRIAGLGAVTPLLPVALILVTLLGIPMRTGTPVALGWEWAAAFGGAGVGIAAAARRPRNDRRAG